ncbi:hypothetical protein D7Z26_08860 [Cohnella endophytica]|uniref:Uncharacterized protein n=2 Tax=Cohnella endophytica TaxID=2419778 RepID=A0A494Y4T0_9BACL|nr:hypothetical protein D7Z26_08860 [Cohnella endophytica]
MTEPLEPERFGFFLRGNQGSKSAKPRILCSSTLLLESYIAEGSTMKWVYWSRLYDSKFQAGCLVQRMEHDSWVFGVDVPQEIEVFRSRKGKYGVRYLP